MKHKEFSIYSADQEIIYSLIKRPNQRYIKIKISNLKKVSVSAPARLSDYEINNWVNEKKDWIIKNLNIMESRPIIDPFKEIPLEGESHKVVFKNSSSNKIRIDSGQKEIIIYTRFKDKASIIKMIKAKLVGLAKKKCNLLMESVSKLTGIKYSMLSIRNQKTKWGSSSSSGTVTINFRIILTPPEIQQYLVVHELCHQKYLNHSRQYWDYVAKLIPDYKKYNRWLKKNTGLMSSFR